MRLAALALALLLAGCAAGPDEPLVRDPKAPISSQVDATATRLAGLWTVRASWGEVARPGEAIALRDVAGTLWLGQTALPAKGNGRFGGTGGIPEWWVLWLDADNRTAAIGTPGGEFGWIMDRKPRGGDDRIRAASEIMQWMGYDMARVKE